MYRGVGHGRALELSCSLCLHTWPFPRNRCSSCGTEEREAISYYSSPSFPATTLQVCSSCGGYLHLIDLVVEPAAVADVDEAAGLVLDLWAAQQGFSKRQPNLAGM